jgi:hypothetical protein
VTSDPCLGGFASVRNNGKTDGKNSDAYTHISAGKTTAVILDLAPSSPIASLVTRATTGGATSSSDTPLSFVAALTPASSGSQLPGRCSARRLWRIESARIAESPVGGGGGVFRLGEDLRLSRFSARDNGLPLPLPLPLPSTGDPPLSKLGLGDCVPLELDRLGLGDCGNQRWAKGATGTLRSAWIA